MFYTTTWFFEEGCWSTTARQMLKLCSTTESQSVQMFKNRELLDHGESECCGFLGLADISSEEQIQVRLG